ncbi:cytochrome-c oxidase, cbb3-type subunit III [Alphaproteobacteria bacterium 46_93_T64]|nr:cytochrome-c oxidase, cbb3-type subunit III [Alphaproteobacteria bacterium 46_93_T64]
MVKRELDEVSGTETTGHEWDGIKELDNPMPRWWLWAFIISIVWGVIYMAAYPAWPLITEATKGFLGYSSRAELADTMNAVQVSRQKYINSINALSLEEIRNDSELARFAYAGGKSAFAVNCSQCHGSGAAGSAGYPNLNDDNWLWGGSLTDIQTTISHGIRFEQDDDTRFSEMPAFGGDEILDRTQIGQVADYVLSLSKRQHDFENATAGAKTYADNCAACHGDTGQGDREQGAPQLSNVLWLYGNEKADIIAQISRPKHGVMPAWGERLDATTIKQLTIYVHALGGGE